MQLNRWERMSTLAFNGSIKNLTFLTTTCLRNRIDA